jgi:hypothetical protein
MDDFKDVGNKDQFDHMMRTMESTYYDEQGGVKAPYENPPAYPAKY